MFSIISSPISLPVGKRSRPLQTVTLEKRKVVSQLLAFGQRQEKIIPSPSILLPTLSKNYFSENDMSTGGLRRDNLRTDTVLTTVRKKARIQEV